MHSLLSGQKTLAEAVGKTDVDDKLEKPKDHFIIAQGLWFRHMSDLA